MKKLGFGLMRLPLLDNSEIDIPTLCKMTDMFIERGFTYFDTAWMYCKYKSEEAVKEALVKRHKRDEYTLATKLHCAYLKCKEDRDGIFNEQLRKTGVEYFDYYLLHDMGRDHIKVYEEYDCINWIKEKKAKGLVKHFGFSFHDTADVLDEILTKYPEFEFVQLQINYLDWENEGIQSRKCHEVALKHGKDIIIMEPVKGGTLAFLPAPAEKLLKDYSPDASVASWAIRFAASLPNVMTVLSGMSNVEQLADNTSFMTDFVPLDEKEKSLIFNVVDIINSDVIIPCTGCSYCTGVCKKDIAIPEYFSLYNADLQEYADKDWKPQGEYYQRLCRTKGTPSDCIKCGACERICPQKLKIRDLLKKVDKHFNQ